MRYCRGFAALFAVKLCFTGDAPNSIAAMPPLTLRRRRLRRSLEVKPRRKSTAFPQIDGHSPKSSEIMRMEEVKPALWRCSQTHEERSQGNGDLVLPHGAGYPQRAIATHDNMILTTADVRPYIAYLSCHAGGFAEESRCLQNLRNKTGVIPFIRLKY
jgi:hypothetical protein